MSNRLLAWPTRLVLLAGLAAGLATLAISGGAMARSDYDVTALEKRVRDRAALADRFLQQAEARYA